MSNGLLTPDDEENSDNTQQDFIQPSVIHLLASDYTELPHAEAVASLEKDYKALNWKDKDEAARNYAEAVDKINQHHDVTPHTGIQNDFSDTLEYALNERNSEEDRLARIDEDFFKATSAIYSDPDNTQSLAAAAQKERELDAIRLFLRRGIISKDTSWVKDRIARAADAAISPLAGTADAVFETDFRKSLRDYTVETTKPELDDSLVSMVASYGGNIAGFAASSFVPFGPALYLGASLTNQSKEVYDTVLQETGDAQQAEDAMIASTPWNVLGVMGDKFVGGIAGKMLKGKTAGMGIVSGLAKGGLAEGVTETLQEFGVGKTLTDYTGNPEFTPDENELLKIFAVSSTVGGAIGAAGGAVERIKSMNTAEMQKLKDGITSKIASEERRAAQAKRTGKTVDEIRKEEGVGNPSVMEAVSLKLQQSLPAAEPVQEGQTTQPTKLVETVPTEKDSGFIEDQDVTDESTDFGFAWPAEEEATSLVFAEYLANEMGVELVAADIIGKEGVMGMFGIDKASDPGTLHMLRKLYKNPAAVSKVFLHELAHKLDVAAEVEDGRLSDPIMISDVERHKNTPAFNKMLRVYQDFRGTAQEADAAEFLAQADALDMSWSPYPKDKKPEYTAYRESGVEQFANVMSAVLNEPTRVRENYPAVWKAFKKAADAHPKLAELLNMVEKGKTDPSFLYRTYAEHKKEGQNFHIGIIKSAKEKALEDKKAERRGATKAAFQWVKDAFASTYNFGNDIESTLLKNGADREQVFRIKAELEAVPHEYEGMWDNIDLQLDNARRYLEENVNDTPKNIIRNFSNLLDIYHYQNDTNETVDEMKANPNEYKRAVGLISEILEQPELYDSVVDLEGFDLLDAFAKVHSNIEPKTRAKAQKQLIDAGEESAAKFLDEETFAIRRYMPTRGVGAGKDIDMLLESFKNFAKLTDDWKYYDKALQDYHKVGYTIIDKLDYAGLLDEKTKNKLVRNVQSYSPQTVMRYFEQDPRINAGIRKAVGSLERTGNAMLSYGGKMKALYMRAAHQVSQNAAVELAREHGTEMRQVVPKKHYGKKNGRPSVRYDNLYDTRILMEQKNPDKSYIIESKDGVPSLWEIDDPGYSNMFKQGRLGKNKFASKLLDVMNDVNKMFCARYLLTVGSRAYGLTSKFRDKQREALLAHSHELNYHFLGLWPRHSDPKLHQFSKEEKAAAKRSFTTGEKSALQEEAFDHYGLTDALAKHVDGLPERQTFEEGVYNALGEEMPGQDEIRLPDKIQDSVMKLIRKIPFTKSGEEMMRIDEQVTKQMAYRIARKIHGKGPWEAAYWSRHYAGTPDPASAGKEMHALNIPFMFSRAHSQGLVAEYNMFKDDRKNYMMQYIQRKLLPRMMLSSAIMGPIIGHLFGEEKEEVFRRYYDKIPSYKKLGYSVIPLGFIDDKGDMRFFDVKPGEITSDWKAAGITIPMERDLITVDQLNTPLFNFIEDLLNTGHINGKKIMQDISSSFMSVFAGHAAPGAKMFWDMGPANFLDSGKAGLFTGNPQDYFRKRGILPKDVAEAEGLLTKFYHYMHWTLYNNAPSILGRPAKKNAADPLAPSDYLSYVPQLGATFKRFMMVTNYGDMEKSKDTAAFRKYVTSKVKLEMGNSTKDLYKRLSRYAAAVRAEGASTWRARATDKEEREYRKLNSWKFKLYNNALQEMRELYLSGDSDGFIRKRDQLEDYSKSVLKQFD